MKTLYLHIGSYKTGTTSIQNTFHANRKNLARQGFIYPGNLSNHHHFFFATKSNEEDWPRQFKHVDKSLLKRRNTIYFNTLEKDLTSNYSKQIFSTEYLFIDNKQYIENIYTYLSTFFSDIRVYVFIRNPADYFKSIQQQMIKARSFVCNPVSWKNKFRTVIEAWKTFFEVEVIAYQKEMDSCQTLCEAIGLNYHRLNKPDGDSNSSLSIEQMLLLEKIQHHLYQEYEDRFKNHLGLIQQMRPSFTHAPQLREWVQSVIYSNHLEDLYWLKEAYGINFLQDHAEVQRQSDLPAFDSGKVAVRDVYRVPDNETIEKFEALVMDALLKKMVENR
ncbi:hypothetical protein [Fodinibius sediminis]|uniref:Sulfotransferase domain-containing protein n=1 Tax=Fodinibius sediminis TaxID=1214077 RepID=A0A521CJI5_9BACT|nr:hypothetical protein [Fodinibius sediminis]SMO59617.1 hypothetical protein SAMN06265218_106126 [Fodinibius sediminis]